MKQPALWLQLSLIGLLTPALAHCAAAGTRVASASGNVLPALGNEATLVLSANRLAAGDWHTCAVVGAKRELFCWGAGATEPGEPARIDVASSLSPHAHLLRAAARRSPCVGPLNSNAMGTRPAPMWWAPEQNEVRIDAGGASRHSNVSLRPLWAVRQVVLKRDVGCALLVDGDAACWQLSSNQPLRTADVRISMVDPALRDALRGAARIVSDGRSWCGVRAGAPLSCVGGQAIGDTLRGIGDVVDIAGDVSHNCALHSNGAVYCWGENDGEQLGVPDAGLDRCIALGKVHPCTDRPVSVPLSFPAKQVASASRNCALLANGSVHCWGGWAPNLRSGQRLRRPRPVKGLSNILQVSLNGRYGCALGADGSVRCFVQHATNMDDAMNDSSVTVIAGIERAREIAVGKSHACALLSDRSVWCWGANQRGQLGDGTCESRDAPVRVLPPHSVSPPILESASRAD